MRIGEALKELRERYNISRKQMVRDTEISESTIYFIEKERKIPLFHTISEICKRYGWKIEIDGESNDFGKVLKEKRATKKISQKNVAKLLGLGEMTIVSMESLEFVPQFDCLMTYLEFLGCRLTIDGIEIEKSERI